MRRSEAISPRSLFRNIIVIREYEKLLRSPVQLGKTKRINQRKIQTMLTAPTRKIKLRIQFVKVLQGT